MVPQNPFAAGFRDLFRTGNSVFEYRQLQTTLPVTRNDKSHPEVAFAMHHSGSFRQVTGVNGARG
jgi:hypothetical protein